MNSKSRSDVFLGLVIYLSFTVLLFAGDPAGSYYRRQPTGAVDTLTIHRIQADTPFKITGTQASPEMLHELEGKLLRENVWTIEITRTHKTGSKGKCKMFGTLIILDANRIHVSITSTDGKDDLPTDFHEECDWGKVLPPS